MSSMLSLTSIAVFRWIFISNKVSGKFPSTLNYFFVKNVFPVKSFDPENIETSKNYFVDILNYFCHAENAPKLNFWFPPPQANSLSKRSVSLGLVGLSWTSSLGLSLPPLFGWGGISPEPNGMWWADSGLGDNMFQLREYTFLEMVGVHLEVHLGGTCFLSIGKNGQ